MYANYYKPQNVLICIYLFVFRGLPLDVSLLVEVREEEVKHDCMSSNEPDESLWIVAVHDQQLECMDHHEHELDLKINNN